MKNRKNALLLAIQAATMAGTDVAEKKDQLPAVVDLEADSGSGFEQADADAFTIPMLRVLQTNSPQCDEDQAEYIEGARAGMFYNTATHEVYDGKEGLRIIVCDYERQFIQWGPRDAGGGLVAIHTPAEAATIATTKNDKGKDIVNGTQDSLEDTRKHPVIVLHGDNVFPAMMALSSTQIKKSKQIMSVMSNFKLDGKNGKFTPPMYYHLWDITTVSEENAKGSWKGIKFERVQDENTASNAELYTMAKEFQKQIRAGEVKVVDPDAAPGDDIPGYSGDSPDVGYSGSEPNF